MATEKKVPTCGDCIHADVCARVPYFTEFSRDNPAYCQAFKNKADYEEVVRCKDCVFCNYNSLNDTHKCSSMNGMHRRVEANEFCSYGERKTMTDRLKLAEILGEIEGQYNNDYPTLEQMADGLIAKGVTIPVRCKDCTVPHNRWTGCPKLNGLVPPPDFYCAYRERKDNGQ